MSQREPKWTVDTRHVNINGWIRSGYLRAPGSTWSTTWLDWANRPVVVLTFTYRNDRSLDAANSIGAVQIVNVIHKRCGPSGWRQHFQCPQCRECVDALFVADFRDYKDGLGCRHCFDLSYGSKAHRALRRISVLRTRAGMDPDFLRPVVRPKGMHRKTFERLRDKLYGLTLRWGRNQPYMAKVQAQLFEDLNTLPAALEAMVEGLRSLPNQSPENADTIRTALDTFHMRYDRLMSEAQRTKLYAALPPPPPEPPRIYGGTGDQRRYRPPRPASRRQIGRAEHAPTPSPGEPDPCTTAQGKAPSVAINGEITQSRSGFQSNCAR